MHPALMASTRNAKKYFEKKSGNGDVKERPAPKSAAAPKAAPKVGQKAKAKARKAPGK